MELSPVEIVTTDVVSNIDIKVMRVELFKSATIYVTLSTATGKQIKSECMELSGDDYVNWANDDGYLYTFAARKMGYTVQPKTTPVVADPVVTDPVVTDPA